MRKKNVFVISMLSFFCGALAGFALRNSEAADYNAEKQAPEYQFDESAYFTDDYLKKAKAKRKAEHAKKEQEA